MHCLGPTVWFLTASFPAPQIADGQPGEFRIHPLSQGKYQLRLRTTDSRLWLSEEITLAPGETKRVRAELQKGALLRVRVEGAQSESAPVAYALEGLSPPGRFELHTALSSSIRSFVGIVVSKHMSARADEVVEFPGLPPGSFTIRAIAGEHGFDGGSGSASVVLRSGEIREVVIQLAISVPVIVEVNGSDGIPISGRDYLTVTAIPHGLGMASQNLARMPEGSALLWLTPNRYNFRVWDAKSSLSGESDVTVVGPGDGDHVILTVELPKMGRGRVVNTAGVGIGGVVVSNSESGRALNRRGANHQAVTSNADGEFEIALTSDDDRLFTYWNEVEAVHNVRVPRSGGEELILVRDDLRFHGKVLDAQTREPIAVVLVRTINIDAKGDSQDPTLMNQALLMASNATTNAAGEFSISGFNKGRYQVQAIKDDAIATQLIVDLRSPDDPPTEILIAPNLATLSGNVTDDEGRPIQGFRLSGVQRLGEGMLAVLPSVETDNAGHFEASSIPAGNNLVALFEHQASAGDGRYFLAHLAESLTLRFGETTTYDFVAISGARLVVHVVKADGMPVRGAEIRLTQSGEQVLDQARLTPGPTTTDRNGRLMFRAIPPGTYTARATLEDGRTIEGTVTLDVWENKTVTLRVE